VTTTSINRLLLATDFSACAKPAETYAAALASAWRARLSVVTVLEFPPGMDPEYPINQQYLRDRMRDASEQLTELKGRLAGRGLDVSTQIETGMPSELIQLAASREEAQLIVLGTRGKSGLAHVLLGSTAERVIRTAPCPCLAVHATPESAEQAAASFSRILVPLDFSDCSMDAFEYAAVVAAQSHASLDLFHVLEPVCYNLDFTLSHHREEERKRERITTRMQELAAALTRTGLAAEVHLRGGVPADAILGAVRALNCDLIVMGTHGRRGLSHFMAGSVTEAVLRKAQCPVLTVRSPKFSPGHQRVSIEATAERANP